MSINHHFLAKTTTDSILAKFKTGHWKCCGEYGVDFNRVGCDSTFPSPDATFQDGTNKLLVSFEFKPPTETKRGILTGLGQSIAYLNSSNLSYLIIPQKLGDYDIGDYMTRLFKEQISDKLPVGLILYENDNPTKVDIKHNVKTFNATVRNKPIINERFWAKHQDLPIPLFHLILHCYYLKKIGITSKDGFAYCWDNYLAPKEIWTTLKPAIIKDVSGNIIKTLRTQETMEFYPKIFSKINKLKGRNKSIAIQEAKKKGNSSYTGDGGYASRRKEFMPFFKHIGVIDSEWNLTDDGFKLYHLGLVNGPSSKVFTDYFAQTTLIAGHHLDLIFDFDNLCNQNRSKSSIQEIKELLLRNYEERGMIKRNPNRKVDLESSETFFKFEFLLWNALDLFVETSGKPEKSFNWKKITEICSLPEL